MLDTRNIKNDFFLSFKLNQMQNSEIRWMATKADNGLGIEHRRKENIVCKWDRIMDRWTDKQTGKNRCSNY